MSKSWSSESEEDFNDWRDIIERLNAAKLAWALDHSTEYKRVCEELSALYAQLASVHDARARKSVQELLLHLTMTALQRCDQ